MNYVIRNHKNLYIRLNQNGRPVTCAEHEKALFEQSKAKNILDSLPKTLRKLKFKEVAIPDIQQHKKTIGEKDSKREDYVPTENITRWVEKLGKCGDILNEAEETERQLIDNLKNNDKELIDILHIIEIEKPKDMFSGWKLYKCIRNNRIERRSMKDELLIVENVLEQVKNISCFHREKIQKAIPSLMINEGFASRKLKNPQDFENMRDRRLELKKVKDKRQQPLKIVINSAYGILKDRNSACFDPVQSNNVCIAGQLYLTELAARLEDISEILQINTDGIYVRVKTMADVDKVKAIAKEWEDRTKLELEFDVYKHGRLVQKDVNNYLLIDLDDGHYKCKGAYVKKLSSIDYDLPILNKALVNYFVHDIPVEKTINDATELIEFQKVIKLTSLYKGVVYGEGKKIKGTDGKEKVMVENGIPLKEKVHRVFASTRKEDKGIYKVKVEKGQQSYEKVAYTPDKCFIDNNDIHGVPVPDYLDRQYYIDAANERIKQFLEKEPEKIDETPNVLFKCMCESKDFYTFLEKCRENGITNKVLEGYLIADCCSNYGKTEKLLRFREYFNTLYGKSKINVSTLEKKISDKNILNIIILNSELSKTGKSYNNLDSKKILLQIFDALEDRDINPYKIMEMQVSKFNAVRYKDDSLNDNRWFILNTRDIISPNIIIYNMKTGKIQYRKVSKEVYKILPLYDGDIIDVIKSEKEFGKKIIGKDDNGLNIIAADIDKEYDVITQYDIVHRNFGKGKSLIENCEVC